MEKQPKYSIYPSLLISFQNLLDYELTAEEDWNKVSQAALDRGEYPGAEVGDYKLSFDEMHDKLEVELINTINRIPKGPMEAADKGTAFNEIVDCLIENRKSGREDCKISTTYRGEGKTIKDWLDRNQGAIGENAYFRCLSILNKDKVIRGEINGFTFDYDVQLCKDAAEYFRGSLTQFLAEGTMDTKYGPVRLYGYIDEWVSNQMIDIKTTSRYNFGKYEHGWQRHIYPWCVIEAGLTTEIESFTYWVLEWAYQRKGEPLTAKGIYEETYTYDHADSGRRIKAMLEAFIEWLESRKEFIQDRKIFGGENPEGWHGTPLTEEQIAKLRA